MATERHYHITKRVKLPESVDVWGLAAILEMALREEAALWQSYQLHVRVTLAEDDGLVNAGSVLDARTEADRTQSRVSEICVRVVDENPERSLETRLNPLHPIEPNVTISAEGPAKSEVVGKAEVVQERTERWIADKMQPSLTPSNDPSQHADTPVLPSRFRSVWPLLDRISEKRVVIMILAFLLAALATWLGIEGFRL